MAVPDQFWTNLVIVKCLNCSFTGRKNVVVSISNITDLINALPGNSSVNTVQHSTIEEAVFSVEPLDAPIDWLDSDHVICVYCRSMSVPRLYNRSLEL
jgi:hypothetical protein